MAAAWAHLLELPHKMNLSRDDYLTVQQIYRGWGLVVVAAFLVNIALTIALRPRERPSPYPWPQPSASP
jgi:hypothetical protein